MALAGAAGAAVVGLLPLLSPSPSVVTEPPVSTRSALRPHEALAVALALALVAQLVSTARPHFGDAGLQIAIALAALVEAHAPVASLASLHADGTLPTDQFIRGVLVALGTNTLTRCAVAATAGGRMYALRVTAALVASLACACIAAYLSIGTSRLIGRASPGTTRGVPTMSAGNASPLIQRKAAGTANF